MVTLKVTKYVCYILGFILDPSKGEKPTKTINLIGTEVTLNQFNVEVNLPLRKRTEIIIEELAKILQKKRLTPSAAAKIQPDRNCVKPDRNGPKILNSEYSYLLVRKVRVRPNVHLRQIWTSTPGSIYRPAIFPGELAQPFYRYCPF